MREPDERGRSLSETFGRQTVTSGQRTALIRDVFDSVAPRYDLMNDLMSFGVHRLWKRTLARAARHHVGMLIDLAGGTGDVARSLANTQRTVVIVDPSLAMMREGRSRHAPNVAYLAGTGEAIPVADNSVEAVTVAFGIRNVTSVPAALLEITRVLKPGGQCLCLEFSKPWGPIKPLYDLYSWLVIPRLGAWVARQPKAYTYLVESIRRFPDQREMKALMEDCGLREVRYRNLSFGIACLHSGVKPSG